MMRFLFTAMLVVFLYSAIANGQYEGIAYGGVCPIDRPCASNVGVTKYCCSKENGIYGPTLRCDKKCTNQGYGCTDNSACSADGQYGYVTSPNGQAGK